MNGRRGPAKRFEIFTTEIKARKSISARRRRGSRLFEEKRARAGSVLFIGVSRVWLRVGA